MTIADFREVFTDHVDSLYFLGLLLTGDHEKAEQCFVAGLEDSLKSNQVFAKWAHSWAKRTVIRKAVRLVQPCPLASAIASAEEPSLEAFQSAYFEIGSVLALEDFQRFVFVLSVLEQYSDYECALLLGSSGIEVRIARTKAVEEVFHSHAKSVTKEHWHEQTSAGFSGAVVCECGAESKTAESA